MWTKQCFLFWQSLMLLRVYAFTLLNTTVGLCVQQGSSVSTNSGWRIPFAPENRSGRFCKRLCSEVSILVDESRESFEPTEWCYKNKGKYLTEDHIIKLCTNILQSQLPSFLQNFKAGCQSCEGKPGLPGSQGLQGRQGDRGFPGYPGRSGRQGYPGLQGLPGIQGLTGEKGLKGDRGAKGERQAGPPGPPGPTGSQGPPGHNGEGLTGPPGYPGLVGGPGIQGKRGLPGNNGVCDLSSCYAAYNVREDLFRKGPNS